MMSGSEFGNMLVKFFYAAMVVAVLVGVVIGGVVMLVLR